MERLTITKDEYNSIIGCSERVKSFWEGFGIGFLEAFEVDPSFKSFIDENYTALGRTLEFCCGAGRNLLYLLERGVDVYGFDFVEASILHAREEAKKINDAFPAEKHIQVATMYDLRGLYDPESFDSVIAYGVLYMSLYKGFLIALNELTRVLKEGGNLYAVMRTGTKAGPKEVEETERGEGYTTLLHKYNNMIRVYFQPDFFIKLIERMGFSFIRNGPEFDYGKNAKAMEFIFKKDLSKKDLEIIVERG